ncbi:right-handed parallel beta-helix repeat-containing protein [Sneathiella sp. CAU 1612]|uniref:Right-handed parallel beta-helix repeat-containing protein n=1 Tax=Sneathiella sedimenti TaxID=2816034 RepID=A0ABS3F280_9PROT|nr:right-handed parallel beta-helix repeat-containing protein [Sneathiella sedimenti]MBO0332438.1 right-handed parallel beta-helix repeat-containing protein [Sneathiella sedimenti]
MTAHTLKLTSSFLVFLAVALMAIPPALARDHFVDPASVGTADGSKASPWRSLQDILNEHVVLAGDRVVLAGGSYGRLVIQDKMMSDVTSVVVADGQQAIFENVEIMGSANWVLSGLTVTSAGLRKLEEKYHVRIDKKSRNIKIEEFTIYTVEDISDWSADDWNEKALDGIFSEADYTDIRNNNIRNVNFGISTLGVHSSVVGNNIENFSGDGLRGLGDHSLFEENVVKNCYQVNPNHSDGFQSWSTGADGRPGTGVIKDVTLRRNLILNYEDFNQRYACKLEGIGLFDGVYEDWTIENNIIAVDNWHGISVFGARNVRIKNNTVMDIDYFPPGPAAITIISVAGDDPREASLVANNIANEIKIEGDGVERFGNIEIDDLDDVFVDIDDGDFRLPENSEVIDRGVPDPDMKIDYFGNPRPVGKRLDVGAVEKQ